MIKCVIVEDNVLVQKYFIQMIEGNPRFKLLAGVTDAFDAEKLCEENVVDLVLMDVQTKNNHSGLAASKRIKAASPNVKVVVVTSLVDPEVLRIAKESADSLWYKDHGEEEIITVINRTLAGERIFPDEAPTIALKEILSNELSQKQTEILRMFVKGYTYAEMAKELDITTYAVRWHLDQIVARGGFENKHELLATLLNSKFLTTLIDD